MTRESYNIGVPKIDNNMDYSTLFNVPEDQFELTHQVGPLGVFHYTRDSSDEARDIRGVVVDLEENKIVMWPIGLHDAPRVMTAPYSDNITIGIEGAMGHVFNYKGVDYVSTSKRIYELDDVYLENRNKVPQIVFQLNRILGSRLFDDLRKRIGNGVHSFIVSYQTTTHNQNLTFPHLYEHGAVTYIGTRDLYKKNHESPYRFNRRIVQLTRPIMDLIDNNDRRGPRSAFDVLDPKPPIVGTRVRGRFQPAVFFNNKPITRQQYDRYSGSDDVFFVKIGDQPTIIQTDRAQRLTDIVNYNTDVYREFINTYMDDRRDYSEVIGNLGSQFVRFIDGTHIDSTSIIDILNSLEDTIGMNPYNVMSRFVSLVDQYSTEEVVEEDVIEDLLPYRQWIVSWVLFMDALTPWHKIYMIDHLRRFMNLLNDGEWATDKVEKIFIDELPPFPSDIYDHLSRRQVAKFPRLRDHEDIVERHRKLSPPEIVSSSPKKTSIPSTTYTLADYLVGPSTWAD